MNFKFKKLLISVGAMAAVGTVTGYIFGKIAKKSIAESEARSKEIQEKAIAAVEESRRIRESEEEKKEVEEKSCTDMEPDTEPDMEPDEPVVEEAPPKKSKGGRKKKVEKENETEYTKIVKEYVGSVDISKPSEIEFVPQDAYEKNKEYHEQCFLLFRDDIVADDDMVQIDKKFFGDDLDEHFGEFDLIDSVYIFNHKTREKYVITEDSRYYCDLIG